MADLFEYLEWRGDVPLSIDPFNEVDNLVLAELAYTEFDRIVPEDGSTVPLSLASEAFFRVHTKEELLKNSSFTAKAPLLMEGMLSGSRFQDLQLFRYINRIDAEKSAQVSAICFLLSDGTVYVAFRGTDNSLVGWKEDFNLSYLSETAGQQTAVLYLNETAEKTSRPLRVGGHSKGGNFAVYAASFCSPSVQDRILTVYTNDGPGFREEVVRSDAYLRILPKIVSIIPDTSIIGLLLSGAAKHRVVRSAASGILQHDPLSWCVQRNRFVDAELSDMGKFLDRALDTWVDSMDDETRESFTDTVFSLFESTGLDTFQEISRQKWKSLESILGSVHSLPKDKQSELLRLAGQLLQSGRQAALQQKPFKKDV